MPASDLLVLRTSFPKTNMADPHRLPPLEGLRYFECVARHGSITQAVSQKLLALEERIGLKLFLRLPRGLRLTEEGEKLYDAVSQALSLLRHSLQTLRTESPAGPLKVRVMPSFATKWLLPRMGEFSAQHPDIQLLVDADMARANFNADEVDIAVTCEWTDNTRLVHLHLFDDVSYPVASTALVQRLDLRSCADLAKAMLLHDSVPQANYSTNWDLYFQQVGFRPPKGTAGPAFSRADLVLQAAISGQGVALSRHSLCADDVLRGNVIRPVEGVLHEGPVYLVYPREFAARHRVAAFIAWMQQQAEAHLQQRRQLLGL
jgi:LysR family glycine cleavage system transcriptional activator